MNGKWTAWVLGIVAVGLIAAACGGRDPYFDRGYVGRVYNAADGSCEVAGQSFDFYIDGHLLGHLRAGTHTEARLEGGTHVAEVVDGRGTTVATHTFTVAGDGWYYWYGCADGTHP
jgi:hypothetical protein